MMRFSERRVRGLVVECNVKHEDYVKIVTGQKTFLHAKREKYGIGDELVLRELRGDLLTGRCVRCVVTGVYSGELVDERFCVLSFQPIYPESDPKIPISVFMEMQRLYNNACRECERLKGEV